MSFFFHSIGGESDRRLSLDEVSHAAPFLFPKFPLSRMMNDLVQFTVKINDIFFAQAAGAHAIVSLHSENKIASSFSPVFFGTSSIHDHALSLCDVRASLEYSAASINSTVEAKVGLTLPNWTLNAKDVGSGTHTSFEFSPINQGADIGLTDCIFVFCV